METGVTLQRLATAYGLQPEWLDINGQIQHVAPEVLRHALANLGVTANTARQISDALRDQEQQALHAYPGLLTVTAGGLVTLKGSNNRAKVAILLEGEERERPCAATYDRGTWRLRAPRRPGYHQLHIGNRKIILAVVPKQAVSCDTLTGHRSAWGLAVQLYSLRNQSTEGVGDFPALRELAELSAKAGAAALAISPLHAQFSADGGHFSPYSPSSRRWLNIFHIKVAAAYRMLAPDLEGVRPQARERRAGALVDWPGLAERKLRQLARLFVNLKQAGRLAPDHVIGQTLGRFTEAGGQALKQHALFEALHAHFLSRSRQMWHWRTWPSAFRSAASKACEAFARAHADQVDFHIFLQWLAACQLAEVADFCRKDMAIGLISDIAVGSDGGGSQAWAERATMLDGFSIGAPPDAFNMSGQDWGITSFSPHGLAATAYRPFIDLLRSSLHGAGGTRLDHILGLARLWIIPRGASALEGVYLRYPLEDLLRLAVLESHRHEAFILGEDLGTVPNGFREALRLKGISGMEVLWFQRQAGTFLRPQEWSPDAVGMTTTHDLPTVAGWWRGSDLRWRKKVARPSAAATRHMDAGRKADRTSLWACMRKSPGHKIPGPTESDVVVDSVVNYLGRTRCGLVLLPLEDALGLTEQPNLPGTIDEHPNWRRRLPTPLNEMFRMPEVRRRLRNLRNRQKSS